jgi:uncharacterized protein (DUF1697 family)
MRHLALLRGINVGGRHLLSMADLADCFRAAGALEVSTYIQSGNVLFTAPPAAAPALAARAAALILDRFALKAPVILRSHAQLRRILADNPFRATAPESALHVLFLADPPAPGRIQALDPGVSPGDRFQVQGQEVYLHLPNGVARSKLTNAWFDSRLATVSTSRNWKTVTRLAELLGD